MPTQPAQPPATLPRPFDGNTLHLSRDPTAAMRELLAAAVHQARVAQGGKSGRTANALDGLSCLVVGFVEDLDSAIALDEEEPGYDYWAPESVADRERHAREDARDERRAA